MFCVLWLGEKRGLGIVSVGCGGERLKDVEKEREIVSVGCVGERWMDVGKERKAVSVGCVGERSKDGQREKGAEKLRVCERWKGVVKHVWVRREMKCLAVCWLCVVCWLYLNGQGVQQGGLDTCTQIDWGMLRRQVSCFEGGLLRVWQRRPLRLRLTRVGVRDCKI